MGSNPITGPLGVAQSGQSAGFGSRDRRFKSDRPDHAEWASSKATCSGHRKTRVQVSPPRPFRPVSSAAGASRLHRDISWVRVPHRVRALTSVAVARARHARGRLFDPGSAHQPAFVYQLGSWAFNPRKPGQHRQAGPIASTSGSGVWATNPERGVRVFLGAPFHRPIR